MTSNGLLLDTHAWIWLLNGDTTLKPSAIAQINEQAQSGDLYIAGISTWEVGMLVTHKRLTLTKPCLDWVNDGLQLTGIQSLPLSPSIAVESCQLPGDFHGGPADRIIVATARIHNLTLMTRDTKIIKYAKKDFIKAIKA
jgi:PIN domain nuclease of toxin-antitoxin system